MLHPLPEEYCGTPAEHHRRTHARTRARPLPAAAAVDDDDDDVAHEFKRLVNRDQSRTRNHRPPQVDTLPAADTALRHHRRAPRPCPGPLSTAPVAPGGGDAAICPHRVAGSRCCLPPGYGRAGRRRWQRTLMIRS
jgi:hypothetical protein